MFTGIIEELGAVKEISRKGGVIFLSIQTDKCAQDAKTGDSIAVNGVCLTVVRRAKDILGFELLEETFRLTNLGKLKSNEKVNLERSLRIGDRLSGHFVTGHIDCLGAIREKTYVSGNLSFKIAIPQEFLKFIALKGSIAVDGISLTVSDKRSNT
ncbi:MAG: riboflavin synthase subunit alpha, partial [Omnitrophica WOR_2 bacterium GWB2_45_9]